MCWCSLDWPAYRFFALSFCTQLFDSTQTFFHPRCRAGLTSTRMLAWSNQHPDAGLGKPAPDAG
jgi:hypothetical protein